MLRIRAFLPLSPLNEDAHYSSYIPRNGFAESFTLNFGATFLSFFLAHFTNTTEKLLCDPQSTLKHSVNFFEHLYPMTPQIRRRLHALKHMTKDFKLFIHRIDEEMAFLYENLLKMHSRVIRKIDSIRAQKKSTRDELYRRLHIARDYLDSCYQGTITLENLSMIACLSRYHLLRHFKMCFGITPHQYLMQRRIKEAGILLKTTKLSFSEICGFVGFEDRSSFSRLFKAFYKQTPAQFRRS
ncbi:helix-turn-helix transcriptional regulator [bacterium]|nr:helix-turn-helix transcriptional regulator [bacterium]